jgi:hypothetical protein
MVHLFVMGAAGHALAGGADPLWEDLGGGRVDWAGETVVSTARGERGGNVAGLEMMEGSARTQLGPRMLTMARRVRVRSDATADDLLGAGDLIADRLDDNLATWEATEVRYHTGGDVEVDGALGLHGWLRPALVLMVTGRERATPVTGTVTGLVVDARGLRVRPCVAPRVLDGGGQALYSLEVLTPSAAAARSPAQWVGDAGDHRAARRAGENPVFARAKDVVDGCDVVLADADAAAVRREAESAPFLLGGYVVIVVDPP